MMMTWLILHYLNFYSSFNLVDFILILKLQIHSDEGIVIFVFSLPCEEKLHR